MTTGAPSYGRRLGRGAAFSVANSVVLRLGSFATGIVVARLIAPHSFGVFAVALTVHAIIVNASELGVTAALVRSKTDESAPTVMTIALGSSTVLAAAMFLSAGPLTAALGDAAATGPVRVMSLTVVLAGVSAVPVALLTREFRQDRIFVADAVNFCSSTATLLVLAFPHLTAMDLAWSRVAGQLAATLLLVAMAPLRTHPGWDVAQARLLLRFGLPLAGASMVGYLISNYDYIVVGHLKGAEQLGLYALAFNIAGWPIAIFSAVTFNVAMPAIAGVRHEQDLLAERVVLVLAVLSALALPVSALTLVLSGPLVATLYGSPWSGTAPVLSVLALFGALRVVVALLSTVFVALGLTRRLLLAQVLWLVALGPVMVLAVRADGILGAGWAHVLVTLLVVLPLHLRLLRPALRLRPGPLLAAVGPPLLASGAAALAAVAVSRPVPDPLAALACGSAAGLVVYLLLLRGWLRRTAASARALWRDPVAAEPPSGESGAPVAMRAGGPA